MLLSETQCHIGIPYLLQQLCEITLIVYVEAFLMIEMMPKKVLSTFTFSFRKIKRSGQIIRV